MESIDDRRRQRTPRFAAEPMREAFGQRLECRSFGPNQLSYLATPPEGVDVEAAIPLALEDWEAAA